MRARPAPTSVVAMRGALVVGLLAACACTSGTDTVRRRFAGEFDCSSDVVVRELGGTTFRQAYRVTGCGHDTTYYCGASGPGAEYSCIRDSEDRSSGGIAAARSPAPAAGDPHLVRPDALHIGLARALRPLSDRLVSCLGRPAPPLRLQIATNGSVRAFVPQVAGTEHEACAVRVLAGLTISPAPDTARTIDFRLDVDVAFGLEDDDAAQVRRALAAVADGVRACGPTGPLDVWVSAAGRVTGVGTVVGTSSSARDCVRARLTGLDVGAVAAERHVSWSASSAPADVAADVPDDGAAPPVAASDALARLRAAVRSHGPDVVACVGRAPVGVHATWDARGPVTLAVQGTAPSGPEERCVQAAVGAVSMPPGTPGDEIILVR